MKKNIVQLFSLLLLASILISGKVSAKQKKILVFTKTAGFRHTSAIASGKTAIIELGAKNKFDVDTTENAAAIGGSVLSFFITVIVAVVILVLIVWIINKGSRMLFRKKKE